MAQWVTLPDGRLVNFEGVRLIQQNGSSLVLTYSDGEQERLGYTTAALAAAGLAALTSDLASSPSGGFSLTLVDHENVGLGLLNVQVLIGTGFSRDLDGGGVFRATVTIGVDVLNDVAPGQVISYVDDRTLILSWTPSGPAGTYNLVYSGPVNGSGTLVNAVTEA